MKINFLDIALGAAFIPGIGWGESFNGAAWYVDGTYGGNSFRSGLKPENYSGLNTMYKTFGVGISAGSPLGFAKNKGYTLTTR